MGKLLRTDRHKLPIRFLAVVLLLAFMAGAPTATTPKKINFQGRLQERATGGTPASPASMSFKFTDKQGNPLNPWTESHTAVALDTAGYFNVVLGSVTALPTAVFSSPEVYVQISVAGQVVGTQELHSVPYAYETLLLQGLSANYSGVNKHILKTTTNGRVGFGGTTDSVTALFATGYQYGVFATGDAYGVFISAEGTGIWTSSDVAGRPALFCQGASSLAPVGSTMNYAEALHLSSAGISIESGSSDLNQTTVEVNAVAGKVTLYPSNYYIWVKNSYVAGSSQVLVTTQNDVSDYIWVKEIKDGFFRVDRKDRLSATPQLTAEVAFLVLN